MRKLLAVITAMLMLAGLAACGEDTPLSSAPTSSAMGESSASTLAPTATQTTVPTAEQTTAPSVTVAPTTTATATIVTTTTTKPLSEKEQFLAQEKITISGSPDDEPNWLYIHGSSLTLVREATFDSGKGGAPAEIVQLTDLHINKINDKDREENNPSVMSTYAQRKFMAEGSSRARIDVCMNYAQYFDQTVITGDAMDYMTWGAMEILQDAVWKRDPNALVTLGNHDPVRVMGLSEDVADPTSRESRYAWLQQQWKHDVYYTSRVIKNKAMVIQLDNSQNTFWPDQVPKLKSDIEKARKNGYVVLLFMHIPLASLANDSSTGATGDIWKLVINNADVVQGVFAGHTHTNAYKEIVAKTPDGKAKTVRQYVLNMSTSGGAYVRKIIVK